MAPDNDGDEPMPLRGDPGQSEMRHHPRSQPPLAASRRADGESPAVDRSGVRWRSGRVATVVVLVFVVLVVLLGLWRLGVIFLTGN